MRRLSLPLLALVSLSSVGCIARVDANVKGITQSAGQQDFPGAGQYAGNEMAMSTNFMLTPNLNSLVDKLVSAKLDKVQLVPKSGITSLDFLRRLDITVQVDGAPDLNVITADDPAMLTPAADGSITLPVALGLNPEQYLKSTMNIQTTLDIMAPADDWTLGIMVTLDVDAGTNVNL